MVNPTPVTSPVTDTEALTDPAALAGSEAALSDANPVDSSPADSQDAKAPVDLLSVVKSAVEVPAVPEVSSPTEDNPAASEAEVPADAAAEGEEDANLPFHNHPRWQALLAERDGLKDSADRWQGVEGFMQQHGLSGEEVAEGYQIMALLKSNAPESLSTARDWFAERLDILDGMLGNVLPIDLQSRVDSGLLDEDGAFELAQARAKTTLLTQQEATRTAATAAERQQQDTAAITNTMVTAVEGWEARTRATDPDYQQKADLVLAKCQAIILRTGQEPRTAAEATALADKALGEVNAIFASSMPKPRPITPSPIGMSATVTAAPKSLREAINAAV